MQHQFRPRKGDGRQGDGRQGGGRRGRGAQGLPKVDNQADLEQLPAVEFNTFDQMTPAELAKAAKKAKISIDQDRVLVIEQLLTEANPDSLYGRGILEILNDGWGFLRRENYLPSPQDIYVSQTQVKRFGLRSGDTVFGLVRAPKEGEKYHGMLRVESVNGFGTGSPEMLNRKNFDELTPLHPDERIILETHPENIVARVIDLISPTGKGQRSLIVSPPKAGKTTILKTIANSISANHPECYLMVLLVDERP
ncbi:MAG TPA: hypothetical protein PKA27_03150, partial [Fimbriimonadaceae bacterium]|nr:hypothetical protein [Fimbriimonadaceae bacterium]